MGILEEEDKKRELLESSIKAFLKVYDEKTQLVYLDEEEPLDTKTKKASLFFNFCFAFALFRIKTQEDITKAKTLLSRLLPFQIKAKGDSFGAFPKYLHTYPSAGEIKTNIFLYVILQKLEKLFGKVMEKPLRKNLISALSRLLTYIKKQNELSYIADDVKALTAAILEIEDPKVSFWLSSKRLESFVFLNLFLSKAELFEGKRPWHPNLQCYAGPFFHEFFEKNLLRPSLFDLFMTSFYEKPPSKQLKDHYAAMLGSLILYSGNKKEATFPVVDTYFYKELPAKVVQEEKGLWFYFEDFAFNEKLQYSGGFHLLSYLYPAKDKSLISFVCQTKSLSMKATKTLDGLSVDFTYPNTFLDDKKDHVELDFFITKHPDVNITVDHKKATIFKLSDTVYIESNGQVIELKFSVKEGKGDFLGHICMENRPSQIHPCTQSRATTSYEAYDFNIALRTLRRESSVTINLQMKVVQAQKELQASQELDCLVQVP